MITPADIIGLTNATVFAAMNDLAGRCKAARSEFMEAGSLLAVLAENPGSDVSLILKHYGVAPVSYKTPLRSFNFRGEAAVGPSLAVAIDHAAKYGLCRLRCPGIRSGFLLVAAVEVGEIPAPQAYRSGVNARDLLENYREITKSSCESDLPHAWDSAPAAFSQNGSGATSAFTVDLTARAKAGELDPVFGRDDLILRCAETLARRRQNNPVLLGDAGVGKTAVAEGLAQWLADDDPRLPKQVRGLSLHSLDLGLLASGAAVNGEKEKRITSLIKELTDQILFIDEIHMIVGGVVPNGQPSLAELFKPALARGSFRTVGATTWPEYKANFERDAALVRRFHPVPVREPDDAAAALMVRGAAGTLAKHHDVNILDEAVEAAVRMTRRYVPSLRLPDKAISTLDLACVRSPSVVDARAVAEVIADSTGIHVDRIAGTDAEILSRLAAGLPADLSESIVSCIKKATSSSLPSVFVCSGGDPSPLARTLAVGLFGTADALLKINMADYADHHAINALKGSPPGYIGSIEGGFLTEFVRRRPGCVVLARNAELACPPVRAYLEAFCLEGEARDGTGVPIDFRNCVLLVHSDDPRFTFRCEAAETLFIK